MLIDSLLLVLLIYSFYGCSINNNSINENISLNNTNSLKAIFVFVVIFCHLTNTVETGKIFWIFDSLGTFAVAIFLFISGYGLIKRHIQTDNYEQKLITKRIPKLITMLLFVSIFYIAYYLINGYSFTSLISKTLGMFSNGDSIVNNSWYVYLSFELYLIFFIAIKLFKKNIKSILLFVSIFCLMQMILMKYFNFCMCWYVTTFNFAFGAIYSFYEKDIISFIKKHYYILLVGFTLLLGVLFYINLTNSFISDNLLFYIFKYIVFSICIILVTYKINLGNKMLNFIYPISFEIYLIHGLVIMILEEYILNDFLLSVLCIILSIVMGIIVNKAYKLLSRK